MKGRIEVWIKHHETNEEDLGIWLGTFDTVDLGQLLSGIERGEGTEEDEGPPEWTYNLTIERNL